jgi:branched-chain amino acid transport system permease protein
VLDPIMRRPMRTQITFTLGLLVAVESLLEIVFSPDPQRVRAAWARTPLDLGFMSVALPRAIAFAAAVALTLGFLLFLRKTWWGAAIRAVAQHPEAAQLLGIPRRRTLSLAFALATAATGLAGMLTAPFLTMSPYVGSSMLGAAFAAVVLGTEGNVVGAAIGGALVGLAESVGTATLGGEYKDVCLYGLTLLMLLARPQGLFGATAHA